MAKNNLTGLLKTTATRRAARIEDLHLDLPVPTWDGDLVMRFKVVEREVIEQLPERHRTVDQDVDVIVSALQSLWSYGPEADLRKAGVDDETINGLERMKENKNYFMLKDENGLPIKFDTRFVAAFFDEDDPDPVLVEVKKDPQVVDIIMWAFKDNSTAIAEACGRLVVWSANTDRNVNDGLLPESRA